MRKRVAPRITVCLCWLSAFLVGQDGPSLRWDVFESGTSASFRGICAVSDQVAWVSGSQGTVLLTTDGGKTFKRLEVPESEELDFRDVYARDEKTAWLLSAGSGELSRIYKTVDGGQSWRMTFKNAHPEGFLNGLAFWDRDHGIAVGDPLEGRLFVLTTTDAGDSWQRVAIDQLPPVRQGEYGFAASGTNVVVAGQQHAWIGTGGAAARVFRTSDRGRSWEVSETPVTAGASSAGIFSLYFRDTQNGWAIGGDYQQPDKAGGNLARTYDGGSSWSLVEASPALAYRSAIAGLSSGAMVAAGPSGSELSQDGGDHWRTVGTGFHTLSVAPRGWVWAAGADGRIARASLATD